MPVTSQPISGTYTPIMTLVGGSGNTVPVFTTNSGRATKIGDRMFVDILLTGDGGAEGAGTGVVTITLPIAADSAALNKTIPAGQIFVSATGVPAFVTINASGTTFTLKQDAGVAGIISTTGDILGFADRSISLSFSYEV